MINNIKINFSKMSQEELRKISLEKNNIGIASKRALAAQKYLWEQAGEPFSSSEHFKRDMTPVHQI